VKVKYRRYVLYCLLTSTRIIIAWFPRAIVLALMRMVSQLVYYGLPKERKKVMRHLRFAYGEELSDKEMQRIAKGMFTHFGRFLGDLILMWNMSIDQMKALVDIDEAMLERIKQGSSEGRGVIIVTGHMGSWELLATYLKSTVYHATPTYVIARRLYFEPYNNDLVSLRKRFNIDSFYRDNSFREIIRMLRKGYAIGILPDQDVSSIPGIFVDFFGKKAYTTDAPARLAYSTGAVIMPLFMLAKGDRYALHMDAMIEVNNNADKHAEIERITQELSSVIEKTIRAHPEQWGWMHNRWKTKEEDKVDTHV